MQTAEPRLTGKQRGAIFSLAAQAKLDMDALHDVVLKLTGSESIAALTPRQAVKTIEHLRGLTGQAAPAPAGWLTDAQRGKVFALCRSLGWTTSDGAIDMDRLEGFIKARFGIERFKWVRVDKGRRIIEALKQMEKGGRGERRKTAR